MQSKIKYILLTALIIVFVSFGAIIFILFQSNLDFIDVNLIEPTANEFKIDENRDSYLVTRVVDGDTINIDYYGKKETVRFLNLDSPEFYGNNKDCYGLEAKQFVEEELLNSRVYLVSDEHSNDRDRYNRLLRYVFINNQNFNIALIRNGYAKEVSYTKEYIYKNEFKAAETLAKKENLGIWSDSCDF